MTMVARRQALRAFRGALVDHSATLGAELTAALPWRQSLAESLSAEVIPLAEACRFLERQSARLLKSRRLGMRGRPLWLFGVRGAVHRDPWGKVLVLAPHNYPLLLAGVPMLQAFAAGNTVMLKPGMSGTVAIAWLKRLADEAGFGAAVSVLDESVASATRAIDDGVDHVVLTGSATTGRAVLKQCATSLTPVTCELSGCDAMVVLDGADIDMAADAIGFAMRMNESRTCIAPRSVWVQRGAAESLRAALAARDLAPSGDEPLDEDRFEPVFTLTAFDDLESTLAAINCRDYALGASVFGPTAAARSLANRLDVGMVTVNDLIVPTADPRVPFGGRRGSGYGVTRGAEGLLAMTQPRAVLVNRAPFRAHLQRPTEHDAALLQSFIDLSHGRGPSRRFTALRRLTQAAMAQRKAIQSLPSSDQETSS